MRKKLGIIALVLALTFGVYGGLYYLSTQVLENGWVTDENGQMYFRTGVKDTGVTEIDGEYYAEIVKVDR